MKHLGDIDWARKINERWIVGECLRKDAAAYLDFLDSTDPHRLRASCHRARFLLDHRRPSGEDPKPWFYSGLFSLVQAEEAKLYLRGHDFTLACIPGSEVFGLDMLNVTEVRSNTAAKIHRIRAALTELSELADDLSGPRA